MSAIVCNRVEHYGGKFEIETVVTLETVGTAVTVDRNKHVYITLQQFVSEISII